MESKPWIKQYDAGVPPTLQPYPTRTLLDILADNARERPNPPGLLFKGAKISYADLERLSDACAAALVGCCITKGDRVALIMPNYPKWLIGMFGAWKAGAIVAP